MATASDKMRTRLVDNLTAEVEDNGAPKKIISAMFIEILMDMLLNLFTGCMGASGKQMVAGRIKEPNSWQRRRLREAIRNRWHKGSHRKYKRDGGENVYDAVLKTSRESQDDVDDAVDEIALNYDLG